MHYRSTSAHALLSGPLMQWPPLHFRSTWAVLRLTSLLLSETFQVYVVVQMSFIVLTSSVKTLELKVIDFHRIISRSPHILTRVKKKKMTSTSNRWQDFMHIYQPFHSFVYNIWGNAVNHFHVFVEYSSTRCHIVDFWGVHKRVSVMKSMPVIQWWLYIFVYYAFSIIELAIMGREKYSQSSFENQSRHRYKGIHIRMIVAAKQKHTDIFTIVQKKPKHFWSSMRYLFIVKIQMFEHFWTLWNEEYVTLLLIETFVVLVIIHFSHLF